MRAASPLPQPPHRQRVRDAAIDMLRQDPLRRVGVAFQGAVEQSAVLLRGGAAAVLQGAAEYFSNTTACLHQRDP